MIKVSFMQRRKTLLNALSNSALNISKEKMERVLKDLNIDTRVRGEALSIEQFAEIAKKI